MPKPRPLRSKSPADVHFEGKKSARRQRVRHTAGGDSISSPAEISGLHSWFDFSNIVGLWKDAALSDPVTADGDTILGVTDKSGGGHSLTVAANGPTYETGIQNSLSICRFNGSNDTLRTGAFSALSTAWTCFVVFDKIIGPDSVNDALMAFASTANKLEFYTNSVTSATHINYFDGAVFADVIAAPDSWGVKAIRVNSASSMEFFSGGGSPVTIDPSAATLSEMTRVALGSSALDAVDDFGDYDIGEFALYSSALTAAQVNLVGNYLKNKWNLTWTNV